MAYRYLKELCDAGLLVPQSGGQYGLGPRIIELERLVALTDPLYLAGRAVLKGRSREDSAYLLQNLYEDKVLCIYKEGPDVLEHAGRRTVILRARGQPFPLFQGSGSLALLAFLPHHRIRQTYLRSAQAIAAAGLGEDWAAFRRALAAIRRRATPSATSRSRRGWAAWPCPFCCLTMARWWAAWPGAFRSSAWRPTRRSAGRASWRGWRPRSRASTWRRPGVAPEAESGAGAQRLLVDLVGAGAGQRVQDLDHRWHLVARQVGLACASSAASSALASGRSTTKARMTSPR